MKTKTPFLASLLATVLLQLGLARAAEHFDPIMAASPDNAMNLASGESASLPCSGCIDPHGPSLG